MSTDQTFRGLVICGAEAYRIIDLKKKKGETTKKRTKGTATKGKRARQTERKTWEVHLYS